MGFDLLPIAVEGDAVTAVGSVVTQVFSWAGTVFDTMVSHPVMFLGVAFSVAFSSVGLVRKLVGK